MRPGKARGAAALDGKQHAPGGAGGDRPRAGKARRVVTCAESPLPSERGASRQGAPPRGERAAAGTWLAALSGGVATGGARSRRGRGWGDTAPHPERGQPAGPPGAARRPRGGGPPGAVSPASVGRARLQEAMGSEGNTAPGVGTPHPRASGSPVQGQEVITINPGPQVAAGDGLTWLGRRLRPRVLLLAPLARAS